MTLRPSRWLPVAFCLVLVGVFSTAVFSSSHTGRLLAPWIHWLSPTGGIGTVNAWNGLLRKSCHLLVYGILALCWFRALAADGRRRTRAAVMAVVLTVAIGTLDELHQEFVAGRTGRIADVLLDGLGATLGVLWGRGVIRRGPAPAPTEPPGLDAWAGRG
jgi:hypothetical protein